MVLLNIAVKVEHCIVDGGSVCVSITVHHCDAAQRKATDKKWKRSRTHYVQSHRDGMENRNGPMDFLGLYFVA